jgi:hypothetical protein
VVDLLGAPLPARLSGRSLFAAPTA